MDKEFDEDDDAELDDEDSSYEDEDDGPGGNHNDVQDKMSQWVSNPHFFYLFHPHQNKLVHVDHSHPVIVMVIESGLHFCNPHCATGFLVGSNLLPD